MSELKLNNKIDFFLVGAARCGTTSLYNLLNNNHQVFLPNVKEPNFFSEVDSPKEEDFDLPKPDENYHSKIITSQEIYDSLYENASENQLKGDTSPSYLWDKNTAKKIYAHNPKAKIIISLRHPVDRAYSHYIMNYFTGVDKSKTFHDALLSEKNLAWGSCNQYLEMSAYYEQVKMYFDTFPKEQVKILVYEDWINNMNEEINSLFQFLEIEACSLTENNKHNTIKPVKNISILNFLRQNKIKRAIKNILSQERIENLKAYLFNDDREIEKLDEKSRTKLSLEFTENIKQLSNLTQIQFDKKWN